MSVFGTSVFAKTNNLECSVWSLLVASVQRFGRLQLSKWLIKVGRLPCQKHHIRDSYQGTLSGFTLKYISVSMSGWVERLYAGFTQPLRYKFTFLCTGNDG